MFQKGWLQPCARRKRSPSSESDRDRPFLRGDIKTERTRTQFYGRGPHFFDRRFASDYRGLLIGKDPVALDAVGARLLQLQRIAYFGEDCPLDTTPKHIFVADEEYKLGVGDLHRIEIIRLGWMEGALI
jgi:hypothetical protein